MKREKDFSVYTEQLIQEMVRNMAIECTFHTAIVIEYVALRGLTAEHKEYSVETSLLARNWCIDLEQTEFILVKRKCLNR